MVLFGSSSERFAGMTTIVRSLRTPPSLFSIAARISNPVIVRPVKFRTVVSKVI